LWTSSATAAPQDGEQLAVGAGARRVARRPLWWLRRPRVGRVVVEADVKVQARPRRRRVRHGVVVARPLARREGAVVGVRAHAPQEQTPVVERVVARRRAHGRRLVPGEVVHAHDRRRRHGVQDVFCWCRRSQSRRRVGLQVDGARSSRRRAPGPLVVGPGDARRALGRLLFRRGLFFVGHASRRGVRLPVGSPAAFCGLG
jgi:hypothetical protein